MTNPRSRRDRSNHLARSLSDTSSPFNHFVFCRLFFRLPIIDNMLNEFQIVSDWECSHAGSLQQQETVDGHFVSDSHTPDIRRSGRQKRNMGTYGERRAARLLMRTVINDHCFFRPGCARSGRPFYRSRRFCWCMWPPYKSCLYRPSAHLCKYDARLSCR